MADRTKVVVARVYPKPGRLQEVIGVYGGIMGLAYQEPGCELFTLHTDGETVFVAEKWATPADLQAHAAGPTYAQIRAGISDLVDHAPDVWVLDPLLFGVGAFKWVSETYWWTARWVSLLPRWAMIELRSLKAYRASPAPRRCCC
jgi:quinol monooxygenase YgiN